MTTKTRPAVFETNSSATHSLTICGRYCEEGYEKLKLNRKGQLVLKGGEFEREHADYNDALTKANYCAVYAKLQEAYQQYGGLLGMLTAVLKEQTGATEIVYDFSVDFYDEEGIKPAKHYGSINHQAAEDCEPAFANCETLKRFIFDPNSWLHIDADG